MELRDGCDPFKRLITIAWNNINRRTINGHYPNWKCNGTRRYLEKGIRVEFSRIEFVQWMRRRRHVVNRMWRLDERPSIDRIDSNAHYTLNNIKLTTVRKNLQAGSAQVRSNAEKYMLTNKKCLACGKQLVRRPFDGRQSEAVKRFNVRKTCGVACMLNSIKTGKIIRGRKKRGMQKYGQAK